MAATTVIVQTSAVGVGVAVNVAGSTAFQQVQLVGVTTEPIGVTTAEPAAGAVGMVVRQVSGASMTVTGSVSVAGSVAVGNLATVAATVGVIGGPASTALVVALKSGTPVDVTFRDQLLIVNAQIANVGTSDTQVNTVGIISWLAPTQTLARVSTVNTVGSVLGTVNVNLAAAGTTIPVNVVAGGAAPGTTAGTQSDISGQLIWLAPTQTLASVAVVNTIVTQLGTQMVSMAQTSVSVAVVPTVQSILTIVTQLGTQVVTIAAGATITVVGTLAVNVVQDGLSVTAAVSGTISVSGGTTVVSGTVDITAALKTTGLATVASTGIVVIPKDFARQPVLIMVTSTAIAQSANFYLMTIWTNGTVAAAATTAYPVPAGRVFRAIAMQGAVTTSAVVGGTVQVIVVAATATASMISASFRTQGFQMLGQIVVTALPVALGPMFAEADTPAATTVGVAIVASTAAVLQNVVIQGYLF